jgi:hypothetical protein
MVMRAMTAGREVYPPPKTESRKPGLTLRRANIARHSADGADFVDLIALKGAP